MTILVALACPGAAAVGSDRRQVLHGVPTDDRPKTFAFRAANKQVIGGVAGQLLDGERPLTEVLRELCGEALSLDGLVKLCLERLWRRVPAENGLDVVILASDQLTASGEPRVHHIQFRGGGAPGPRAQADGTAARQHGWFVGGSGGYAEVIDGLNVGWNAETVVGLVRKSVQTAIELSDQRETPPSCGGEPSVEALRFT